MKLIKPLYVFLLFLVSFSLKSQQYPVDVQVFATPPYEQSLRDYWATFEQKIQVHLLLRDLSSPMRRVALRFSLENIQGQPLAQTASYALPYQTQLSAGVRKTLSNTDFKSVLALENLHGTTETFYDSLLPEGAYFFCFTAYDADTQTPLSAKARTLVQIRRHTPPLLTLPAQGEVIAKQNQFQHLVFQWMLRDPAPFTQYEFTLKEVWDNSLNPDEAFVSGRLVYQGKIPSNTILYGPDKPILLENKRYVWKVRAFTQNPNNPNQRQSFFHNNGESEAFYFDYVSHCNAPKFLTATTKDNTAHIRWSGTEPVRASISNADGNGGLYKILYREKGKGWKSQTSNHPQTTLAGLKRGKNYIYKVGIACGLGKATSNVFGEQTYLYSTEQEFFTPHKANDSTSVQCGVKPEIRIKNREPLQESLYTNDTFTAGDFPVTIIRATGSNGVFSGEGYVQVPYLLDTKIKVKFDGVKINTERQLFEGKLITTYDVSEKNVVVAGEEIRKITEDVKTILALSEEVVQTIGKAIKQGFLSKEEYEELKAKNRKNTEQSKAVLAEMKHQNVLTEAEYAEKVQELDDNQSCLENSDCITQGKPTAFVNKRQTIGYGKSFEKQALFVLDDDCTERMHRCKTNINQTSQALAEVSEKRVEHYIDNEASIREGEFDVVINIKNIGILGKTSKDPPVKNGQFIGEISIGSNEDNSNYVWNGELWSKVIDKGNGKYSSIIYGKNNSQFYLEASWSEDDSMETISIKVLRAKNGANFTKGIIDHHDILMTSLGLPASAFTPVQGTKDIRYGAKIKANTSIVSKNYTPVKFRGITYTKPDASRINFANEATDFTPLNKSGNPVQAGWKHISEGHFNREIANSRSVFTQSENKIKKLIQQKSVINTPLVEVQPGLYKRTANLNEIIGKTALKFGRKETSWVEIFTDVKGNIITAYPVLSP